MSIFDKIGKLFGTATGSHEKVDLAVAQIAAAKDASELNAYFDRQSTEDLAVLTDCKTLLILQAIKTDDFSKLSTIVDRFYNGKYTSTIWLKDPSSRDDGSYPIGSILVVAQKANANNIVANMIVRDDVIVTDQNLTIAANSGNVEQFRMIENVLHPERAVAREAQAQQMAELGLLKQ